MTLGRQAERRQAARDRAEVVTPSRGEVERVARDDRHDDRDQRARDRLVDAAEADDQAEDGERDDEGRRRSSPSGSTGPSRRTSRSSRRAWLGTPNIPPTWPIATWMPTPVRNPMSTLRDRKLAMNPSLRSRARIRSTAHISAASDAIATYVADRRRRPDAHEPGRHDRRRRRVGADHEVAG